MKPSTNRIEVKAMRLSHGLGLPLPQYQTEEASGLDLMAAVPLTSPMRLLPGMRQLIPTGITVEIPPGYEGQVRPRSGLALNHGVTVLNSPGTVDSDYRGEIKVLLINLGRETFVITRGQRIAQLVFQAVARAEMVDVRALAASKRGDAGFGSTGISTPEMPAKPPIPPAPRAPSVPTLMKAAPVAAKPTAPVKASISAKPVTAANPAAAPKPILAPKQAVAKAVPPPASKTAKKAPPPTKAPAAKAAAPKAEGAKRPVAKATAAKRQAPVAAKNKAGARA